MNRRGEEREGEKFPRSCRELFEPLVFDADVLSCAYNTARKPQKSDALAKRAFGFSRRLVSDARTLRPKPTD